jgi:O-antigen/teichoic acid export membrane protein
MRISHIAWNLGGLTVPLAIAACTVPHLVNKLGQEKFGLLALAWGLIGYAGALDLGLGRALTQMVASMRGENQLGDIPHTLATASRITLITGLLAGFLIVFFALLGGDSFIRTENTLGAEIQISIFLLAIALPAQAMSATYKGLNEAFMNFKGISVLRSGLGVITFAGPYAVSFFSVQLPWLVLTLVVSRLVSLFIYKKLAKNCISVDPAMQDKPTYSATIARKLFNFGGWITISNIISPLLVQVDRFLIAGVLSASAVSIYVLPYEMVVQILILPGAITTILFPYLSSKLKEDEGSAWIYFKKIQITVLSGMLLVSIFAYNIGGMLLDYWIIGGVSSESIQVAEILCFGLVPYSIGTICISMLHALGRADLSAKSSILQFPVFVLAIYFSISHFGIIGAAFAWVARVTIDAIMLLMLIYISKLNAGQKN